MEFLTRFKEVSLFKRETYGIHQMSLDIRPRRKYHLLVNNQDTVKTLSGLLEGRYTPDTGIINSPSSFFIQSDRLLLEDRIFDQTAGKWFNLAQESFQFGGRRRSKRVFMERLNAQSIRHFPIYRLKGEDKIKFALLAMTFQESGLILISQFPYLDLSPKAGAHLTELVRHSHCAICVISAHDNDHKNGFDINAIEGITTVDLT